MTEVIIRHAEPADLPRLTELYNHYIAKTPITFDLAPFSVDQRRAWFDHYRDGGRHQLLIALAGAAGEELVGYASSSTFRPKAAYDTSVETSVYIDPGWTGLGIGRKLYERLFAAIAEEDVHRAYAGITLPNPASVALHERFGFVYIGVFSHAGRKFGRYWDVAWYEKHLA
jgi:phosphinothricin acetyltransferase